MCTAGGISTPYGGLHGEAPPEDGAIFACSVQKDGKICRFIKFTGRRNTP